MLFAAWFLCSTAWAATPYPANFLWGVTLHAHSVEGMTGGGQSSDWYEFEHSADGRSRIAGGANADRAADHWNRFREDLTLVRALGANTVRITLAWEKIEPRRGEFNHAALAHYREVLSDAKRHGLTAIVSLQNYTHPQWFHRGGGWFSPQAPQIFVEYAAKVLESLGDLCDLWITFENPMELAIQGYGLGLFPPGIASPEAMVEAAYQLARTHRIVAALIHETQGYSPGGRAEEGDRTRGVGIALSIPQYLPDSPRTSADTHIANEMAELHHWAFFKALLKGRFELDLRSLFSAPVTLTRTFPSRDLPSWSVGPYLDWIGVEYQDRFKISAQARARSLFRARLEKLPYSGAALDDTLQAVAARSPVALLITGNDPTDATQMSWTMRTLEKAIIGTQGAPPLDIRGYAGPRLLDGFEWLKGFSEPLGLFEVRWRRDLTRGPRSSAYTYLRAISASRSP